MKHFHLKKICIFANQDSNAPPGSIAQGYLFIILNRDNMKRVEDISDIEVGQRLLCTRFDALKDRNEGQSDPGWIHDPKYILTSNITNIQSISDNEIEFETTTSLYSIHQRDR